MRTVYFDVDHTILYPASEFPSYDYLPHHVLRGRTFYENTAVTELIKDFYARGHTVIVWSAGGEEWAQRVVTTCRLNTYVTHCLAKPSWLFDDKQPAEWLPPAVELLPRKREA